MFPDADSLFDRCCCHLVRQMDRPEAQANFLEHFRADSIVEDCEAVRRENKTEHFVSNPNGTVKNTSRTAVNTYSIICHLHQIYETHEDILNAAGRRTILRSLEG